MRISQALMVINDKFKKFILILLFLFNFLILSSNDVKASLELPFFDNFNDNFIGPQWLIKFYTLEDSGSFGPYTELALSETNGEIRIFGTGTIDIVNVDGDTVGWIGKSLILTPKISQNSHITLETKVKFAEGNTGFLASLTIEFDSDNRIVFNMVDQIFTGQLVNLAFDESDLLRCAGDPTCISTPFEFNNNQTLMMKLDFDPTSKEVKAYINELKVLEGVYNGKTSDFQVGIAGAVRNVGDILDVRIDDFSVKGVSPTNLNVPDIKQYSPHWGPNKYDNTTSVPNTITRWGCALVSATMTLRYYNHDVDPDGLNQWLINNSGYSREAGVNWQAVAVFSKRNSQKIDSNLPLKHIEWKRYPGHNNTIVDSQLNSSQPVILNVPGHFVVAKGKSNGDYFINDPASSTFNLLSQTEDYHGGPYFKIEAYTPTNSDFSYIYLLIDENFQIGVFDTEGNKIEEGYLVEEPITSDDGLNEPIGKPLNSFALPKPDSGNYQIKITGDGVYQLDYYVYDEDGNVKVGTIYGSNSDGAFDTLVLNFNKENSDNSNVPQVSFDSILQYWEDINQDGHVTNHGLYTSIKRLLENALKNQDKGGGLASKVLLEVVLQKVRFATPQFISEEASMYLQKQISTLLSSL